MSYATPGEPCRCDSDLTTPWQRMSLDLHAPGAYGFYVALNTYAKSPYPCEEVYKTALAGAPPRRQSRISSSSSNDGKNLGVTCLYAR